MPVLLGVLFFFVVCLGVTDSIKRTVMITVVLMLLVIAVRFKVLRERIALPFVLLTLYVIMDGISTFYALSGKFALREFLKVLLAYCLSMIMLAAAAKKEDQTGRRLATVLSVCSALASLISIDMFSTHILSGIVFWILGHFTEYYSELTAINEGTRMLSMFVNPNPFAGFAGIGILLSLGLAVTAPSRGERCVDITLLFFSAVGFLLVFSMGASIFIMIAFLTFLALEQNEKRIGLFLLMLETAVMVAVSVGAISLTSFHNTDEVQIIPLACLLLGAAVLCVFDSFVMNRITEKLKGRSRFVLAVVLVLLLLIVAFAAAAWNLTDGATLSANETLRRSAYPAPGEYTLEIQADGPVQVGISSQSIQEAMTSDSTKLYDGDAAEAVFTVPDDSKVVYFSFKAPEGATIRSASVGGEKIPLHYRLLPGFIANRLQGLRANKNALVRVTHFKDGMKLFRRSPIIGLGMGSFENAIKSVQTYYYETKYAHNHYIQALLETGIVGLALFLAVLVFNAIAVWRSRKRQILAPTLGAALIFMAGHAAVEIDFSSFAFLPMAFGVFAMISLCCGDAIKKPALPRVAKTVVIGVSAACTVVYCGFLAGNMMAARLAKQNPTVQTLVRCAEMDRFEWADFALSYVISAQGENVNPDIRAQADVFAERLSKVDSNTIPIYLAEYYFDSNRTERALEMIEKYVDYVSSDKKAWQQAFRLLMNNEEDSEAFRDFVVRLADKMQTWNEQNAGTIVVNAATKKFIAKYR